jgi:CHAT domain-containing protein/tetratricopeptide (TPR) repeat protein
LMPKTATILIALALIVLAHGLDASGLSVNDGHTPQASEPAKKAEELFREALTLSSTKDREAGRLRLLEATRIWMQLGEPEKAARACLQMGDFFKQGKRYQDSLHYYKQALEIKTLPGSLKAMAFNSIAQIYAELYQGNLAAHYFDKAINQARAVMDVSTQTTAWTGLAELHHKQGESEQAIKCIAQAQRLNRLQNNEYAEATLSHLAGLINQEKGMAEQAEKYFEEALILFRKLGNAEGEVKALCSISDLYLNSSRKQAALEQAEIAVKLATEQRKNAATHADIMRARDLLWRAFLSQARAQRAVEQKELAVKSFEFAIHHLEGLYLSLYVLTESSAVAFREACQVPYLELADLLIEQGEFRKAYELAEQARTRAMIGFLQARRMTGLPKKTGQDHELNELTQSTVRLRAQLLFSRMSEEQQASLQNDIRDAEYKLREARLRIEMGQSKDRMVWSQAAKIKPLQGKLALDKRVMLEFFLGENRSFAWLISSDDISLEILPGKKEIEAAVNACMDSMTAPPNNVFIEKDVAKLRGRAERLFSILFGRLSERILPGQKLIIVPDGVLHYLPFEALVHNGHYLLEDHEVSYLPSPGMLGLGQDSTISTGTEDQMEFLAFGDPVFGPVQKAPDKKESRERPEDIARQVRASRGYNLAPLPRTRDEVQYIASLFPPDRQHVYLGKDSTEKAVKQESLRRYRRLHFATHSLIDEKSPSRSAVVLTLNNDSEEDGFLEVSEIAEMDLDCNLVVLSACQTGRGQLQSGEGIVGLSRAFLYAGARSVVVSLWNVNDISTGQLMKSFYQNIITDAGNSAALREAKLKMLKGGRETRHPYYWAPFIVVGKP